MIKKSYIFVLLTITLSIFFHRNINAKEIESLTLSEEPWTFNGNTFGVSVKKELSTNLDGNFYAIYFFNSGQIPLSTTINNGKATLITSANLQSSEKQTMVFKGAFDISSAKDYSIKYHDVVVDDQNGFLNFSQDISIDCSNGKAFYHINDKKEQLASGTTLIKDGQCHITNFIPNPNNIDPSKLSTDIYGILEPKNFDVSSFSVTEKSHSIEGTSCNSTVIVKTPNKYLGLLTIDVIDDNETLTTTSFWIDDTETTHDIYISNINPENVDNYKYSIKSFIPADYTISNGTIEYDGTYIYPHLSFQEIYNTISTGNIISDITILDDGNAMKIDTNSSDASSWDDFFEKDEKQMGYLKHVNGCLRLPETLYEKMRMTTSGSGMHEELYENIKVTWTYTAGHGFEVLYENIN